MLSQPVLRLNGWLFGSIDYRADLGCAHTRDALLNARSEFVLASRLAGIAAPIDGVTTRADEPDAAQADAAHAHELGMTGKLCIHPRQIAPMLQAFIPTAAEVDWTRRVLDSGVGAVSVDGCKNLEHLTRNPGTLDCDGRRTRTNPCVRDTRVGIGCTAANLWYQFQIENALLRYCN